MPNEFIFPLLARAGHSDVVPAAGVEAGTLSLAARPAVSPRAAEAPVLAARDRDPNDLSSQRWAVVAPEGRLGDHLLEAVKPLLSFRSAEQGNPVEQLRMAVGLDSAAAWAWKKQTLLSRREPERPRYLLIVGDLTGVSLEAQQILQNGGFVGRVHASLDGVRSYAEKVIRSEKRHPAAEALFFTATDGSSATSQGEKYLTAPCAQAADEEKAGGLFELIPKRIPYRWSSQSLLEAARRPEAQMLLSVSHGLGRESGRSDDEARATQGALLLGSDLVTGDVVQRQPFVSGGLWFSVACFSAGVPGSSVYFSWLKELSRRLGGIELAGSSLESLASDSPFVSAVPTAALSNPDGPLAFIGHADLAWTYAFRDASFGATSRYDRVYSVLRAWSRGARAGVAFDNLVSAYRDVNDELLQSYQDSQDAESYGKVDPSDASVRAACWMTRNDLRGYMLLGDPAVRLMGAL